MWKTKSSPISKEKCFVTITKDVAKVKDLLSSLNVPKKVELIAQNRIVVPELNCESYSVNCQLSQFLRPEFLDLYVRKTAHHCLVVAETHLNHQDSFAIINGMLFMSLTKATYVQAGLIGQKSKLDPRRYFMKYDLRDPKSNVGNPQFDRLLWSLSNTILKEKFNFVFSISGSLTESCRLIFESCDLKVRNLIPNDFQTENVVVPSWVLPDHENVSQSLFKTILEEWVISRLEWTALVSLGSEQVLTTSSVDSYLSQYTVLDPDSVDSLSIIRISGAPLLPNVVESLFSASREHSWYAFSITGFEDTPVAWKSQEHSYLGTGLNHITVFRLPDHNYVLIKLLNGKDLTS